MEKIFFTSNNEDFVVHLENDGTRYGGDVFPINKYHETPEWGYQSQKDGGHLDSMENARCFFGFTFCWRGVWEGRIYFKDEEYWSEELDAINSLWDKIEKSLKEKIKKDDPHAYYG